MHLGLKFTLGYSWKYVVEYYIYDYIYFGLYCFFFLECKCITNVSHYNVGDCNVGHSNVRK